MLESVKRHDLREDANFFDTFVEQARGRTPSQLVATAVGAAISATFFFQHSSVWLGSAFVAVSSYGAWGLADRLVLQRQNAAQEGDVVARMLATARGIAGLTSVIAVFTSAATFMGAALGGWIH